MTWVRLYRCLCAALLYLCAVSAPAIAQTPDRNAEGAAAILKPLSLIKNRDLNFGYVAQPAGGTGTVVVDPNSGSTTATGGVLLIGGNPLPALFTGSARNNAVVIIRVPRQSILVTRVGGTETMIVSNFTLEGLDKRQVAAQQSFTFQVGATLNVPANQIEGTYVGTFSVSVQYP